VSEKPHYVQSYNDMVAEMRATLPLDEAMSRAVGGDSSYEKAGDGLSTALIGAGLSSGQTLIDVGCGSGRVAAALGRKMPGIEYLGTDIVPDLLEYARKNSPDHFKFVLHREISIPAPSESADMICFFSVLTHLFHQESYVYLRDAKRVLKSGGLIYITFLESGPYWSMFERMVATYEQPLKPHLNMFIERPMLEAWASHLNLRLVIGNQRENQQTGARFYKD
jgi:SAM-dependent methyltransferase